MKIKEKIKQIPLIGRLALAFYTRFILRIKFTTSAAYWEKRYQKGGNSGVGSYHHQAEFKAEVINQFVFEHQIKTVIEFGCGDGNQLRYFHFPSYTGFDVSETAVAKCRNFYKAGRSKRFELMSSYANEKADLTLSLDVIYHLVEDEVYYSYMEVLFSSSNQYVVIYSSNTDGKEYGSTAPHVKHRRFTDWVEKSSMPFQFIKHIPNRFSSEGHGQEPSFADFYIYKKVY
jgi:hypothetical protein